MKKIFDQRFFRLLSECSQRKVSASEFAEAIEELATHVADFSITEQDYSILLRYFSFGLHRLKSYRVWFEQEKNIPEQLQQRTNKQALSPLYLADRTTLINIMEIVSGLFLSQKIVYQNGKPVYLVDLTKAFEWLFNIKIGDCYQKHEDVIKRKPGKLTEFLNGLAELIKKEHDKKGYR